LSPAWAAARRLEPKMTNLAAVPLRRLDADAPIGGYEDLLRPFYASEKPREQWRIGSETERFGVDAATFTPLGYDGERGVVGLLRALQRRFRYRPIRELGSGPLIGLRRGAAKITLEPGAQVELSGAPLADVHAVHDEIALHLAELHELGEELGVSWLATGFHPLARLSDLPHVPKHRYAIMRDYLPGRGSGGLDMMWRTATVQASFDYSSEQDALRKLRLCLRLAPLVNAMTANSPFCQGRLAGMKSLRGDVWLRVDPERTGLVAPVWRAGPAGYRDYVEWALDAGMFLFVRPSGIIANAGQSFRSFLNSGYRGYSATLGDWQLHLSTLFPEVRLRQTLEVRSADALPTNLAAAVPALYTGVLYDEHALEQAEELMAPLSHAELGQARPRLVREGLAAPIGGRSARRWAEQLIEIAAAGLERRRRLDALGRDERIYLRPLLRLTGRGMSPADLVSADLPADRARAAAELVRRTRV
jgi:glutamate--cysteine ligase